MAFVSDIHYGPSGQPRIGAARHVDVMAPCARALRDCLVDVYDPDGRVMAPRDGVVLGPDHATGWTVARYNVTGAATLALVRAGRVETVQDLTGGAALVTAQEGAAAGLTPTTCRAGPGETVRFDAYGARIDAPMAQGAPAVCLTTGTKIDTTDGPRAIETLVPGDLICTLDHGPQPLRMVHLRPMPDRLLRARRDLLPVRISAGALGFGLPRADLLVSPNHRMLFRHIRMSLLFGEDAAFVRAKSLAVAFDGIYVDASVTDVTYAHLVFDRPEVVFAEGAPTESLNVCREALAALDPETRMEVYALFPLWRLGLLPEAAPFPTLRSWELMAAVA